MPIYRNPDFRRLPPALAGIFNAAARESFFALPAWYDLMARYGVTEDTETRIHSDERPGSAAALILQTVEGPAGEDRAGRRLLSLANAYSVEHGILRPSGSDLETGLARIIGEILDETPRWDGIALSELDPRDFAYGTATTALRRAGFLVERIFHSGNWFEDTAGLRFADYLSARPAELRNTWRRKRRRAVAAGLKTNFFTDLARIDGAIADYEAIYARSWKPPEAFPRLMPALIRLAAETGALRLAVATLGGVPAAAQFWIVWNGRAIIYKLAHDKRFDEFSLGTLLTMELAERVLEEDHPHQIHFGRGDDPYKKLWLSRRRERWGISAANPRTVRGLRFGLKREAAKLYHRFRGQALAPPR